MREGQNKHAVVVVHGIGGYTPGHAVSNFAETYGDVSGSKREPTVIMFDPERDYVAAPADGTPPYSWIQSLSSGSSKLHFLEVNWNFQSRMAKGQNSTLWNFVRTVANLPTIIQAALSQDAKSYNFFIAAMAGMANAIIFIIANLIIATNVLLAAHVLVYFSLQNLFAAGHPFALTLQSDAHTFILTTCVLAIAISSIVASMFWKRNAFRGPLLATILLSFITIGISGWNIVSPVAQSISVEQFAAKVIALIGLEWAIIHILAFLFALLAGISWILFAKRRRSIELSFVVLFILVRVWVVLISGLWLFAFASSEQAGRISINPEIQKQIHDGMLNLFLVWTDIIIVLAIFLLAAVTWLMQRRKIQPNDPDKDKHTVRSKQYKLQRLIYPAPLLAYTVISTIVWNLTIGIIASQNPEVSQHLPPSLVQELEPFSNALRIASDWFVDWVLSIILAVTAFTLFASFVLNFLWKVTDDIVLHLDSLLKHQRGSSEQSDNLSSLSQRVIDAYIKLDRQLGPFDRVTFIGESLGSVIVADTLNKRLNIRPNIVTLGSPIDHIFNYYFGHLYPSKKYDPIAYEHWLNVYRADDFVGRNINSAAQNVENKPVSPKGHRGYWGDREVAEMISKRSPL